MKKEIIDIAIENLNHQPNIDAEWVDDGGVYGTLKIVINGKKYYCYIEVKQELRQYQLVRIIEKRKLFKNLIVIANNIYPQIKEELKELDIAYLETNGNFFFRNEECFFLIDTNKKVQIRKEKANRAFTKTGLKIVFHLLNDPELVNKKQREIADVAGVGLGNIPQVLNGLKETGYLLSLKKGVYVWEKKEELVNRWVNAYATELRPRLVIGTYTLKEDWKTIDLNTKETVWGGEPAAEILTNYLRSEKLIVYTKERKLDLIKKYKLVPREKGELEVLDMFWSNIENTNVAPPLLIYAELIITGGKRNTETAQMIYNEYIEPKL